MPIKRLKRDAQFPMIGKLRKGAKKVSEKKPGQDLTYFRFDTADNRAEKMFEAAYGTEPDAINVYLPRPTTDQNFSTWMEDWAAGGLKHRCDGETCTIWQQPNGTYSQEPKPCPGGCKEVGRLMAIIPELQRFAYVTSETHSIHDIMRLTEQMQAVEAMRGTLQGIPFVLRRSPVEISTPSGKGGNRARRTKWLLSIEVAPEWAALQLEGMHRQALQISTSDYSEPVALIEARDPLSDVHSLDDVPEVNPNGPVDGDVEPDPYDEFCDSVNDLFSKDTAEASSWLAECYTKSATPDNVRSDTDELSLSELAVVTRAIKAKPDEYKERFAKYISEKHQQVAA